MEWTAVDGGLMHVTEYKGHTARVVGGSWKIDGGATTRSASDTREDAMAEAERALMALAVPAEPGDAVDAVDAEVEPVCTMCGRTFAWNDDADREDDGPLFCNPCAQWKAADKDDAPLYVRALHFTAADDALQEKGRRVARYTERVAELAEVNYADEFVLDLEAEAAVEGAVLELAEAGIEQVRRLLRQRVQADALLKLHEADAKAARAHRDALDAAIERVKANVLWPACERAGQGDTRRLDLLTARISIRQNPGSVVVDPDLDLRLLSPALVRIKTEVDREAVRAELKLGREVPGCSIATGAHVHVEVR